jgi:SAM-dependent methyltransferase
MDEGLSCPGCGALNSFSEIEKIEVFSVLRCSSCELEFSHPMKNPGREWYERTYIIRHLALDTRIRDYHKWAIASLPIRGKLLDIGCGEGVFVNYAIKKGFDAYGIDFSKEAIDLGKRWYGLNTLFNCSVSELKKAVKVSEFDVITFFEVLEHLDKLKEFLSEVKMLLKKDGYIAVSVPFRDRWPIREFNDYPPHHLTRWTEKSLRTFFEANEFEVLRIRIGSKLKCYCLFIGYLIRALVYKGAGMYQKGLNIKENSKGIKFFNTPSIKYILSALKLRQIRDISLLPIAVITYPFVFPWFKGYNLMLIGRRKS